MPDPAARRKFEALVAAAFADGFLAEAEKVVLQQKAERMGISSREMHEMLGLGQQRRLSISIPATSAEREALLEDMIDVVVADGRVEAPEYSLLARLAETLRITLSELRQRVNRRMQAASDRNTRAQGRRESPPPAPPPPRWPEPAASPPAPAAPLSPSFPQGPVPIGASGPPGAPREFPKDARVADLPPVTLQLLKQSIMFDNEPDSVASIGRMLGVPPEAAVGIRQAILAAFPDLQPASMVVRPSPRR